MRSYSKYYLTFILLLSICIAFAQEKSLDSLLAALKNAKQDTTRLRLRNEIGETGSIFRIGYWDSISVDAKKSGAQKIESDALNNIGFIYDNQGDIPKSLDFYRRGLKIRGDIGDKEGVAISLNNIGNIYYNQGDILQALDYFGRSLKIREAIGNKLGIANSLNNIAFIYANQGEIQKSLDYFDKSLKLQEEVGDKEGIANSLNNLGSIYQNQGNISRALDYYGRSLKLCEDIGDKEGIATSLNNMGAISLDKGEEENALKYYNRSLKIHEAIGDKQGVAYTQHNIGNIYRLQKKYPLALSYLDSSLALSKEHGYPENIRNAERTLSKIDSAMGNFVAAFEHYKQYIIYKDSINNVATQKASIKNQLKYEYEKKEAIIKEKQEKEHAVAEEKNRFQQIIIGSVIFGFLLVMIFAGFVVRSLKTTRKQKLIIEKKQTEILDSIHYAKRIQKSLLPTETYIEKTLNRLNREGKP